MSIKDVLFLIIFVLGLIFLIWAIFGNSPTEFITIITLLFAVIIKLWSISDKQIRLENKFRNLAKDFISHIEKN